MAQQPAVIPPGANTIVVDSFDSVTHWTPAFADGVDVSVHPDSGLHGRGMRIDFDFHGRGGYAVVRRAVNLTMPANYEFSFAIRGEAPVNTLEFKMVDSTGENVWWSNTTNFVFPREWTTLTRKKRQISFAWGPIADKELRRVFAIELAITAGSGGKGSVWIDDLALTRLDPPVPYMLTPRLTATSRAEGYGIERAMDASATTAWRSNRRNAPTSAVIAADTIDIDFLRRREFGGLVIDWEPTRRAIAYDVLGSADGQTWRKLYSVMRTSPPPAVSSRSTGTSIWSATRDYLYLPESDARYLRLALTYPQGPGGFGIRDISVKPLEWAATKNDMFLAMARDVPRGSYPRYLSSEQSYWTVVGADRDVAEGMINEEGMIEVGRGQFSIEPFLYADGKLITWNDARISAVPDPEALPLPRVNWSVGGRTAAPIRPRGTSPRTPNSPPAVETVPGDLELSVSTFAAGPPDSSVLYARYRVTNNTRSHRKVFLYLALRPLQVNPPWQFLNGPGGAARVDTISLQGSTVRVSGNKFVHSLTSPSGFGAVTFDEGNIVDWLRIGKLPNPISVTDPTGSASAAFVYGLELGARATSSPIDLAIPLSGGPLNLGVLTSASRRAGMPVRTTLLPGASEVAVAAQLEKARSDWREKLGRVRIDLPPSAARYTQTLRANLGYILINRDGPAIQPGSRSYSRSWIRDGSLTSTALLRMGHAPAVKEFIEWYATHQYDNGKIPCCVDEHGATPVPENDSHGQFIYLVAEYYRHTGDKVLLEKMWPHVAKTVSYMDSLRKSRMTPQYEGAGPNRAFYGLMPQSISHEGYSAKPMHSYWDDFFALRGFKDATYIARVLDKPEAADYAGFTASFRGNFRESIRQVMMTRRVDYIPGSVELADFDATSTTVAVSPGGEASRFFPPTLQRTFDKYFNEARQRALGTRQYEAYTPYELRTVGVYV
ncbi:MAG: discoidin domain-containing protein, partial [Gemmatimonadota bacterium]|nr:discoidin domain-containing protein [Gemmatimonadota bacterium]